MIVIGIDPHMKTHTAVALDAATGVRAGERTAACDGEGHDTLLLWARSLGEERIFAVEDCRHVSGSIERFLLPRGETVLRVPPKIMAGARASARTFGKPDPIDAECVARSALREPDLPRAALSGAEREVRLLVDCRDGLVGERARIQKRLRWNCHDLEVALELPPRVLDRYVWLDRLEDALGALPHSIRRRIAIEQEIRGHMRVLAPELMEIPGCSAISAAHLAGQTGGRFALHT